MRDVKVENSEEGISRGYFPTYVSASRNLCIAEKFVRKEGIVVKVDKNIARGEGAAICCHVHWLSEFRREREVLFSRCGEFAWQLKRIRRCKGNVKFYKLDKANIATENEEDEELEYWSSSLEDNSAKEYE